MKFTISSILFSTLLILTSIASALPSSPPYVSARSTLQTVYEFPNRTWVENLAVRRNGKILATLLITGEVWQVDPSTHTAELIYRFPSANGVLGIGEVKKDVFAVAVGNWSDVTFQPTTGSFSIWSIDLTCDENPQIKKVTDIPEAQFLNGMTVLSTQSDTVLVGDAVKGVIWRVNTKTRAYDIAMDEPALKANASAPLQLGVNGIRYRNGFVYFVNTFTTPYARIPVHRNGSTSGAVDTISTYSITPDDFALDRQGNAWITTDPSNGLVKITPEGRVKVIAGAANDTTLLGPTSAAFSRTSRNLDVLYISTNGGIGNPPASGVVCGRIVSLDTSKL